jgi:uncharacterized membrane protein
MIQAFLAFLPFIREVIFGRVDQGKKTKPRTVVRMIIYAVFVASLLLNYYTVKRSISLGIQVVKLKEQVKGNEIIREKLAVSLATSAILADILYGKVQPNDPAKNTEMGNDIVLDNQQKSTNPTENK